MSHKPNILIVGAGPTGLTAAIELARRGVLPTVIEKRVEASNLSRAVGIMPSSLAILEPSGVAKALRHEGIILRSGVFHRRATPFATLKLHDEKAPDLGVLSLAQDRTEVHMEAAFKAMGGEVLYGTALKSLSQTEDTVTVQFENGDKGTYDYVIGADGAASAVRMAIGLPYEGFDLPEIWSIADVDCMDWPYKKSAGLFLLANGKAGFTIPLETGRYRVISNTEDALATLPIQMNVTNIRRTGTFTVSVRQTPKYNVGRVYLAGDSAHCHSPVGGRGMNLGIADAAELAKRLAGGGLAEYSDIRHKAGSQTIANSERARGFAMSKNPFKRFIAITLLWVVTRLPFMQKRIIEIATTT